MTANKLYYIIICTGKRETKSFYPNIYLDPSLFKIKYFQSFIC